ncbi:MAG: phage terminase large subunit [Betaproteobacteria bacterium]
MRRDEFLIDIDKLLPSSASLEAELARRKFGRFIRMAWHVIEPMRSYIHNWHIDAISEHLEAVTKLQIRNLVIAIPPGHMKSLTTCVFWPAWAWIDQPHLRWMFGSYSSDLSSRDHRKTAELIASRWYQERWSQAFDINRANDTRIENNKSGSRLATSTGGTGTGERVHIVVNDDLLRAQDANSKAMREQANEYSRAMSTRAVDPRTFRQVFIMQRLHEEDAAAWALEHLPDVVYLRLPAEYESGSPTVTSIGWKDPRAEEGELLWPEVYDHEAISQIKKALRGAASAQLQQRPAPVEGNIIKREWFQHYQSPPQLWDALIMSWDMTFKSGGDSDWVVGQVWGRVGVRKYLLAQVRAKMGFVETKKAFVRFCNAWPDVTAKLIEDKANGPAIIDSLREEISGIIAINPTDSKMARVEAVSAQFESGNVFLPEGGEWVHGFIEEFLMFPNAKHDDQVDCATQALQYLTRNERGGEIASIGNSTFGANVYGFNNDTSYDRPSRSIF